MLPSEASISEANIVINNKLKDLSLKSGCSVRGIPLEQLLKIHWAKNIWSGSFFWSALPAYRRNTGIYSLNSPNLVQIRKNKDQINSGYNTFQEKVYFTEHVDKPNMKQVYYDDLIGFYIKLKAKGKIKQ